MSNYATLIASIQSVITQNGNNEITGMILQQTLLSIINSLGSGYQFVGIATPETNPGTPDQRVFYLASSGTYPNFGPATIPAGNLAVFYYDTSWHYSLCETTSKFASGEEVNNVHIVKDLTTGGEHDVLSANEGVVLFNKLLSYAVKSTRIIRTTYSSNKKILANGVLSDQNYCRVSNYTITDDMRKCIGLEISGYKRSADVDTCLLYAFYDSDNNFISGGGLGKSGNITMLADGIPANAITLKVAWYYSSGNQVVDYVYAYYPKTESVTRIVPPIERGRLYTSGQPSEAATQGEGNGTFYPNNKRTMNFVKVVPYSKLSIFNSIGCYFRIYEYANDYSFLSYTDIQTAGNESIEYIPVGNYIKIHWSINAANDTATNVPEFLFYIDGIFDGNWNVKNVYPLDSGYMHLDTIVYPIDGDCTNAESNEVQDITTRSYDSGLLALPQSYTNNGKPTRLIIYCHGAGVNYSSSQRRFPTTDLLPEYWLAEGYAVMDVDGECNVSSYGTQHQLCPESLQCYVNAYQSVVKKYNICEDGVFLGGRSMGGAMSMYIMESGLIPVVADCPVVPVMNTLWWWSYLSASEKSYLAAKMGFEGEITWGSRNTLTTSEWQYLQDNFDNLRRWSPLWACIIDLPTDKSVLFNNSFRVSHTNTNVPAELELYGNLHAKVKAPVKFFDNYADPTVPYERNALLMYKMLINSGSIAELRMFDTSTDVDTSITAHHFELRTDRLTTVTLSDGTTMSDVPVVYVEMLKFWQRYELNNK